MNSTVNFTATVAPMNGTELPMTNLPMTKSMTVIYVRQEKFSNASNSAKTKTVRFTKQNAKPVSNVNTLKSV